jgi:hypothetical protein
MFCEKGIELSLKARDDIGVLLINLALLDCRKLSKKLFKSIEKLTQHSGLMQLRKRWKKLVLPSNLLTTGHQIKCDKA